MFTQLFLFVLLLFSLFFLSQKIQTYIYENVLVTTKNKNAAIGALIILLLPGTIIHELSHFIIATILRVPTGELTVLPTIEKNSSVKAGKLFLGETDPFRLSLIGLAPIIIGLTLIYFTGKLFIPNVSNLSVIFSSPFLLFVICYLLFVVSLTMFSSKKDMEGLKIAVPILLILSISLYFVGVRVFLDKSLILQLTKFLSVLNYYLVITAVINCLVFLALSGNLYLWQKILKRRVN